MAVDGTYRVSGDAMGTVLEGVLELKSDGEKLTGVSTIGSQTIELKKGKVQGDSFTCNVSAPTPMGVVKFNMTGTVRGDKISGELKTMIISAKYEGERIK